MASTPSALAARALNRCLRLTARRRGIAVAYHRVAERAGDRERDLLPARAREQFAAELELMRRMFDPVPVERFSRAVDARRRGGRFPVCVTFDDDLPEHVDEALPILRRAGVPATFFLCGASLADPRSFWWERLQRAYDRGASVAELSRLLPGRDTAPPPGSLRDLANLVTQLSPLDREAVADELLELAGPDPPDSGLRAPDVRLLAEAGASIGFHTHGHEPLPTLDDRELELALTAGRDELAEAAGRPIDAFAYPHGMANERVAEAARQAGYVSAFTLEPIASTASEPMQLGRVLADRLSTGSLLLRMTLALGS